MATGDDRAFSKLNAIYGTARAAGLPATLYVAGYEVAPDASGGGTEMSYVGYARVAIANTDAFWSAAVAGDREKSNLSVVSFAVPAADTNAMVAVAIHAHITNDDILDFEALAAPLSALAGQPLDIPIGALIVSIPE